MANGKMVGPMDTNQTSLGGSQVKTYPAPKPSDPLSLVKR